MPVITPPDDFDADDVFVDLEPMIGHRLYLKCEGFNFAGSIKLKAAAAMVAAAEEAGRLRPGLGADRILLGQPRRRARDDRGQPGLPRSLCVTDDRCNLATRRMIEALGGQVDVVTEPAAEGGLARRPHRTTCRRCARPTTALVWLDQYRNAANWQAHGRTTGAGDPAAVPRPRRALRRRRHDRHADGLRPLPSRLVGHGTHRRGRRRRLGDLRRPARAPRSIPGVGSGVRPPMLDADYVDDVVLVVRARHDASLPPPRAPRFVFGGSTGTVVAGAERWLAEHGDPSSPRSRSRPISASATSTRSTTTTGSPSGTADLSSTSTPRSPRPRDRWDESAAYGASGRALRRRGAPVGW